MGEKVGKKMFHALYKVDMHPCYTKQKINLACPCMYLQRYFMIPPIVLIIQICSDKITGKIQS